MSNNSLDIPLDDLLDNELQETTASSEERSTIEPDYAYSLVDGYTDKNPEQFSEPFCEVGKRLQKHAEKHTEKPNGPCFLPSLFDGEGRKDHNAVETHWLALDIEKTQGELDTLQGCLRKYRRIVYTTRSHGVREDEEGDTLWKPGFPRLRILLPLASPISPEHYSALYNHVAGLLDGAPDLSCNHPARLSVTPRQKHPDAEREPIFSVYKKLPELDPEELPTEDGGTISLQRLVEKEKSRGANSKHTKDDSVDLSEASELEYAHIDDVERALELIDASEYHQWMLVGHALKSGSKIIDGSCELSEEERFELFVEYSESAPDAFEGRHDCHEHWKSFGDAPGSPDDPDSVTIGTVFHLAKEVDPSFSSRPIGEAAAGFQLSVMEAIRVDGSTISSVSEWFDKKTTQSKRTHAAALAAKATGRFQAVQTGDEVEIWFCNDTGIWQPQGKQKLREWLHPAFGPGYTTRTLTSVIEHLKGLGCISRSQMGVQSDQLAVSNGLLDLRSRERRSLRPNDRALLQLPVEFEPSADCPEFTSFLEETFQTYGGQTSRIVKTIFEFIGYCLLPDCRYQKALFFFGPPETGKTVLLDTIGGLFEGHTTHLSIQKLGDNTFAAAQLENSLVNIRADMSASAVKGRELIKELIVGDSIEVERKHESPFQLAPRTKHIFAANQAPEGDFDRAFYRRWIPIEASNVVPQEEQIPPNEMQAKFEREYPGILNRALDGLDRLRKNSSFSYEPVPDQVERIWQGFGDSVSRFIEERIEITDNPEDAIPKAEVYERYTTFCSEGDSGEPVSQRKLTTRLKQQPGITDGKNRKGKKLQNGNRKPVLCYRGIRLSDRDTEEGSNSDSVPFDDIFD
jgi:P4 family phage/plasmid primase-like protien